MAAGWAVFDGVMLAVAMVAILVGAAWVLGLGGLTGPEPVGAGGAEFSMQPTMDKPKAKTTTNVRMFIAVLKS